MVWHGECFHLTGNIKLYNNHQIPISITMDYISVQRKSKTMCTQSLTINLWSKVHSLYLCVSLRRQRAASNDSICVLTSVLEILLEMNVFFNSTHEKPKCQYTRRILQNNVRPYSVQSFCIAISLPLCTCTDVLGMHLFIHIHPFIQKRLLG